MFGLDHLVSPTGADEFLDRWWGREALLVRGGADKFRDLFGWEDVNALLGDGRTAYPALRLVLETQPLGSDALRRLDHWLGQGATLIVNSVQRFDPVVARLASALAADMNTPVNVNSYTSWPAKQGFDTHYDRHDVFVIQTAGEKAWLVARPTHPHPVEQEAGRPEPPPELDTYLECELRPGDVLYIPRGHWHHAVAVSPSIHLTVGPRPRTALDFLSWLARRQLADEFFRRDLPLPRSAALGGARPASPFDEHWGETVRRLEALLHDESLRGEFLQHCMLENRLPRTYQLPHLVTLRDELTLDTRFVLAPDQRALVAYGPEEGEATVTLRGNILRLDAVPPLLLEAFLRAEGELCGRDLRAVCADSVGEEPVLRFLLLMFEHGIVSLAEE